MALKLAIAGAAGRMGRRLIALAAEDKSLDCVAALETAGHELLGHDAGQLAGLGPISVRLSSGIESKFDVLIEFSSPVGTLAWLELCQGVGRPIVIGTTGHDESQLAAIAAAARRIPVLKSPNMSVGVNVLLRVAQLLGSSMDDSYDVEIIESHHRFKVDAPSGTALALRNAVQQGRSARGAASLETVCGRSGKSGPRSPNEIGVHSLRIGDTVGEHVVQFGNLGETVSIAHQAHSRDPFARGALRAAQWIVGKPPGLYDMQDVIS